MEGKADFNASCDSFSFYTSLILYKEMKEKIGNEYISRVKAVAKSFLYSKNLFTAINVWGVSIVKYSAGIVDWT